MHILFLLSTSLLTATAAQELPYHIFQLVSYPFQLFNGTSVVEHVAQQDELDSPKAKPYVNATVFDHWWFDAVSTGPTKESITVVFYNAGPESIGVPDQGGPLFVEISGTFDNGTQFTITSTAPEGAVIKSGTQGIRGDWVGSGGFFIGSDLHRRSPEYTVSINNADLGVFGEITLQSVSPPHFACGGDEPGVSLELMPNIYATFAQPDAEAVVNFTIDGQILKFNGVGHHEKNWGAVALESSVRFWYWGHGRVGPYSLVWFDGMTPDGKEYFASLIIEKGKIVSQSCEPNSVKVRPWGENAEFPPVRGAAAPSGYSLRYALGEGSAFVANFTREVSQTETDFYKRMIGSFSGGIEGGEQYKGRALCDQFQF